LSASTELGSSQAPSTPTLRVIPPPTDFGGESQQQHQEPLKRQSYHLLTSEEMEMLSHPPPAHSPMSISSSRPASPVGSKPKLTSEISHLGPPRQTHHDHIHPEDEEKDRPGCLGLCEISTARQIGATFGGWFMGVVIPVTSGLVTGCVAAVTGCR
jgi:hypothetical protein